MLPCSHITSLSSPSSRYSTFCVFTLPRSHTTSFLLHPFLAPSSSFLGPFIPSSLLCFFCTFHTLLHSFVSSSRFSQYLVTSSHFLGSFVSCSLLHFFLTLPTLSLHSSSFLLHTVLHSFFTLLHSFLMLSFVPS